MKNLIKVITLATFSLTACYKEPKQVKVPKDTNPKIGISGFIVDSQGRAQANITYATYLGELMPKAFSMTQIDARTNAAGYFNITLRIPEGGAQVNFLEKNGTYNTGVYFKINPPIEKWIDIGTIKVGDPHYMQ
jgi:hypothetical protein